MLRFFYFLLVSAVCSVPLNVSATLDLSIGSNTAASPTPQPTEKPLSDQLSEAQRLVKEAQNTLTRMQSPETAESISRASLPTTLQSDLISAAGNALRNFQRYAESLQALERFAKNLAARQALAESSSSPRLDNTEIALVRDRLNSTTQALEAAMSELKILADTTQDNANQLPKLDQAIKQFSDHPPTEADNWQLTLAKLRKTETESRLLANDSRKKVLTLRIATLGKDANSDKSLLQAEATAILPGQLPDALARLEKERLEINRQLRTANQRDQIAQSALDKARESYLKNRGKGENPELARQQYDLAQTEAETAEEIIDTCRLSLQILDTETTHWNYIEKLKSNIPAEEVRKGIDSLNQQLELIRKWKPQLEQQIRSKRLALESLKRQINENSNRGESEFLKSKAKLIQEQINVQQQLFWRTETLSWRFTDWLEQLKKLPSRSFVRSGFKEMWFGIYSALRGAINYEVFHFKETEMIAGNQVVVAERSVTVARIILALIFFLLGYRLLTKLARFSVRLAQVRFKIPMARTALLEKCLLYSMAALLVLCALNWARIPLTIFAYLGGALAIGVGFGAQNLINNFISGIILLFERHINVGDIVEVDGKVGEVITLGNRCSRMRRGDGVEMLVPNSLLLEKNVTNWTLSDLDHRFEFTFSVAYETPIEKVVKLVNQAFAETPNLLSNPTPNVFFEQFGDSGLIFGVYYWVKLYKGLDAREIGSNLRTRINQLFRNEGVQMPFPQQDIHLDGPLHIRLESQ